MKCEREQQVIEATRSGLWASSLRAHLRNCAYCTQTELIAASLQEDAARLERLLDLPPAGMIWRRAQTRRRDDAMRRATRQPFLIVGALGAGYSVVFLLWGISRLPQSTYRPFVTPSGLTGNVALAGAALSAILAIIGSCVLLPSDEALIGVKEQAAFRKASGVAIFVRRANSRLPDKTNRCQNAPGP